MKPERATGRDAPRIWIYVALVGLFVIWSNSFHAVTYFRREVGISASALVTLRYGPVAIFCLLYLFFRRRESIPMLRRDGWKLLLMGLFMVPGYNLALNWGQGRVPPATASLIIAMNPVFTFLLATALLGERATLTRWLGLAVAFVGIYLLVRTQQKSFGGGYEIYALVVLLAPLCWALATVTGKPITARADPLLVTFAATGLGSLPFCIALIAGADGVHGVLRSLTPVGWGALLHLIVPCTIIGFAIWFWALRQLTASSVSAFVFLDPPFTALFGPIWGTEAFHWSPVLYGGITLLGVAIGSGILAQMASNGKWRAPQSA